MATVEELIKQYETDPELQKEVNDILEDGKITIREFRAFSKKSQSGYFPDGTAACHRRSEKAWAYSVNMSKQI